MKTVEFMTHPIRVLLVEDHDSVREGLCALFATVPDFEVVGDVRDGSESVPAVTAKSPDVVIMDLSMPTSGLTAAQQVRDARPGTAIVVLTRHRDAAYMRAAFAAGATGYVLKQSPFDELKRAVAAAARGQRHIDARIDPEAITPPPPGEGARLSQREIEVLRRAAEGHANKDIAAALVISVKTVEAHKANAMRKLRLTDRSDVVKYALMQGWLQA
jgi:two-component system response regulator NreC